jgi:hypothetical protein
MPDDKHRGGTELPVRYVRRATLQTASSTSSGMENGDISLGMLPCALAPTSTDYRF